MSDEFLFEITKADVEAATNMVFTSKEWDSLKVELQDCLDYYFWDELPRVVVELSELTKEYTEEGNN